MSPDRERTRALRVAYNHARAGDQTAGRRWLDVAATFAPLAPRSVEHFATLLRQNSGPIAGQLDLDGNEHH